MKAGWFFLASAVLLCGQSVPDSTPYYRADYIYRFANHLFDTKDFGRAAAEYERYLFLYDDAPQNKDTTYFQLGECYRNLRQYRRAIEYYRIVIDSNGSDDIEARASYATALCFVLEGDARRANDYFTRQGESLEPSLCRLQVVNRLLQRDWPGASEALSRHQGADSADIALHVLVSEGLNRSTKSPFRAGLYSAVIPGAGKLYCRRRADALQSFSTCAICAWQAYSGFNRDGTKSVKGWIFASLGGVFYLGNIYGSVVAAGIFNEEVENRVVVKVRSYISVYLH